MGVDPVTVFTRNRRSRAPPAADRRCLRSASGAGVRRRGAPARASAAVSCTEFSVRLLLGDPGRRVLEPLLPGRVLRMIRAEVEVRLAVLTARHTPSAPRTVHFRGRHIRRGAAPLAIVLGAKPRPRLHFSTSRGGPNPAHTRADSSAGKFCKPIGLRATLPAQLAPPYSGPCPRAARPSGPCTHHRSTSASRAPAQSSAR